MIVSRTGNLLDSDADALVNAVNTVGVMGKGIALMFKKAFPENYRAYKAACARGEVRTGRMFVTERASSPHWIINFPTKEHFRDPSRLDWIHSGLADLRQLLLAHPIPSLALPRLGCGLGGLHWAEVKPLIEEALGDLEVEVQLYEPREEVTA